MFSTASLEVAYTVSGVNDDQSGTGWLYPVVGVPWARWDCQASVPGISTPALPRMAGASTAQASLRRPCAAGKVVRRQAAGQMREHGGIYLFDI